MKSICKKLLYTFVIVFIFTGCTTETDDDLTIGFVAGLSGKYSTLGVSVRDGFMLGFEEINYTINNQTVQIVQKDDQQNEKKAKAIVEYFIKNDIKLIIGNTTSSMTKISLPLLPQDTLLLSATASSSFFGKKDDNFLRIQVDNSPKRYTFLAEKLLEKGYNDIFFIYDSKNSTYTDDYKFVLEQTFVDKGGKRYTDKVDLNSKYEDILQRFHQTQSNLIVIAGNSLDSANIIQFLRLRGIKTKIFITGWAKTPDFIEYGGKAIEGVLFSEVYDENSQEKLFLEFVEKFEKRYGKTPSAFALQGYELSQILIENLRNSTDIQTLKSRILAKKKYNGLQGDIVFDKYGDVMRDFFMMEVQGGMYKHIEFK